MLARSSRRPKTCSMAIACICLRTRRVGIVCHDKAAERTQQP